MAKSRLSQSRNQDLPASSTRYLRLFQGSGQAPNATEANAQVKYLKAGTFSKLSCRISANDFPSTTTYRLRKNSANGNQLLTVGASTTGQFTDSSNLDTIASGDLIDVSAVTGSGGTLNRIRVLSVIFDASDGTTYIRGGYGTENTDRLDHLYMHPFSFGTANTSLTVEASQQQKIYNATTMRDLYVHVIVNGATGNMVYRNRINGANGALVVTVAPATTGVFEDTTNSNALVSGNLIAFSHAHGSGGLVQTHQISASYISTNGTFPLEGGQAAADASTTAGQAARYFAVGGGNQSSFTESDFSIDANIECTLSNLHCYIQANGVTATSSITTRKNGADGNQAFNITASTTGLFEVTGVTDSIVESDDIAIKLLTGATGTTLTITALGVTALITPYVSVPIAITNKLMVHHNNLILNPDAVVTVSAGSLANLRNPLLSRKLILGTNGTVLINASSVLTALKDAQRLIVDAHTLALTSSITVEAHTSNSWGSPNFTQTLAISAAPDPDTDPAWLDELGLTIAPYRTIKMEFGENILASNNWIRITFTATTPQIGGLFIGSSMQFSVNHNFGWSQGFDSTTTIIRNPMADSYATARSIFDTLRFSFPNHRAVDLRIVRFLNKQFGASRSFWISEEPAGEEVYYGEGIRKHSLTFYGKLASPISITEKQYQFGAFEMLFRQAVA